MTGSPLSPPGDDRARADRLFDDAERKIWLLSGAQAVGEGGVAAA